jgi:Ser/Thr protein kinase RdoA (MazF antagonist)
MILPEAISLPVQNSTASEEAVANLAASEYSLSRPIDCRFWRKGMADAYRLRSAGRDFFLKIYPANRCSERDIQEEVRLLRHLLRDEIGVCEPLASANGQFVLRVAAPEEFRSAVLYRAAEGVESSTEVHRRLLGRMVARMHQSADRLDPPYQRDSLELEHVLDDNLRAIRSLMAHRLNDFDLISGIASYARNLVESSLQATSPEHGVCHGDLHGGDVLHSADGTPVIFDFGSSGTGWRALDIGVFGGSPDWMDTSPDAELARQREVGEFLNGYASIRDLTTGETAVLHLDFAVHHIYLMGVVLRYWTGRDGWHWATDQFIDWHMKWFRNWNKHRAM